MHGTLPIPTKDDGQVVSLNELAAQLKNDHQLAREYAGPKARRLLRGMTA